MLIRRVGCWRTLATAFAVASEASAANGLGLPVETRADSVSLDGTKRELELAGNVEVDASPFHLRSERLLIKRTAYGVDAAGEGRLTFCPCLGTPLAIRFSGVTVAPPGDLFLRSPVLEVYSVPVLWLPFFWLRSAARIGVLPPDIAYRGSDGLFVGGGVHVPWVRGDESFGLNVKAGAYSAGGSAYGLELRTPESSTRVRFDHRADDDPSRSGDGFLADARGSFGNTAQSSAVWDTDVIRGARGVRATSDVLAASLPYDRLAFEGSLREDGFVIAAGLRSAAIRGGGLDLVDAFGPVLTVRRSDVVSAKATVDTTLQGGALQLRGESLSYARGELGARVHEFAGPVALDASGRGVFDLVSRDSGGGGDGVSTGRLRASLPVGRPYGASEDPWLHRLEPHVGGAVLYAGSSAPLFTTPMRTFDAAEGGAWVAESGIDSDLGRWGRRDGLSIGIAGGAIGDSVTTAGTIRGRASAAGGVAALRVDGAGVAGGGGTRGTAFVSRVRIGENESIHLGGWLGYRQGIDPLRARLLTDAPLEPTVGFFAAEGTTGGASVLMPWASFLSTAASVDADLRAEELVAARVEVSLRDRCRCTQVRGTVSRRIGRDGVDAWLSIELTPK